MSEKRYRICLSVPLGNRSGTMVIRRTGSVLDGWIEVMNRKNGFSGTVSDDGQLIISGMLQTLLTAVPYTAIGTVGGRRLLLNLKTESGEYYPISGEELNANDEIL